MYEPANRCSSAARMDASSMLFHTLEQLDGKSAFETSELTPGDPERQMQRAGCLGCGGLQTLIL